LNSTTSRADSRIGAPAMISDSPPLGAPVLTRSLCALIVVIMIAVVFYVAWIAISNFSRIGV